jgi:hypothetical protein
MADGPMQGGMRLGLAIAALFAAAVLAFHFFGNRHEDWFVRTAQENAVRCLTDTPCPRVAANGAVSEDAPPPLAPDSGCARQKNWRQEKSASGDQPRIVLICTAGGRAFLYHLGPLAGRHSSNQQWTECSDASCAGQVHLFAVN